METNRTPLGQRNVTIDSTTTTEATALVCKQALHSNLPSIPPPVLDMIVLFAYGDVNQKITISARKVYKGGSTLYTMKIHPFMNGFELLTQFEKWNIVENWFENRNWKLYLSRTKNSDEMNIINRESTQLQIESLLFNDCELEIIKPPGSNFYVKDLLGNRFVIVVESSQVLVKEAMKQIEQQSGFPVNKQRLIFAGKQMEPDKQLAYYNVERNCTFHVVLRP